MEYIHTLNESNINNYIHSLISELQTNEDYNTNILISIIDRTTLSKFWYLELYLRSLLHLDLSSYYIEIEYQNKWYYITKYNELENTFILENYDNDDIVNKIEINLLNSTFRLKIER